MFNFIKRWVERIKYEFRWAKWCYIDDPFGSWWFKPYTLDRESKRLIIQRHREQEPAFHGRYIKRRSERQMEEKPMNKVGRELKADELQLNTIVVTNPSHHPEFFATMWVSAIGPEIIWFHAGKVNVTTGLFRQPDGTLKDDGGRTIRILEYLGAE